MWIIPFSVAVEPVLDFNLKAAIEDARGRVGMKHERLAYLMGIDSQQLSHQLSGRGHVSLTRVLYAGRKPDGRQFLHVLWPTIGEYIGLEDDDAIALRLLEVAGLLRKRTMAKAQLREHDERQVG